jgi:hypothetical protein
MKEQNRNRLALATPTPLDLQRSPNRLDEGHVERPLLDAVEQLFARGIR